MTTTELYCPTCGPAGHIYERTRRNYSQLVRVTIGSNGRADAQLDGRLIDCGREFDELTGWECDDCGADFRTLDRLEPDHG
jgi:hypothetical protein